MSGYAYTGGGRKVTRVEISLDDGATWKQAEIKRFEEPTSYGERLAGAARRRPAVVAAACGGALGGLQGKPRACGGRRGGDDVQAV
jgi:hypothetical protein